MAHPPSAAALNVLARCIRPRRLVRIECRHIPRESAGAPQAPFLRRSLSTTPSVHEEEDTTLQISNKPRWKATPERMKAPFSLRTPRQDNFYHVNEDPAKLDAVYRAVLGEEGDKLLSEEVKWLAVTHKSFDQGRRGYNDRLAFLGKQIVNLQSSLALLNRADGTYTAPPDPYVEQRDPFRHPGVDLLPRLTKASRAAVLEQYRIAKVANDFGLPGVVRWKPRKAYDLVTSGSETVLAQSLYAIVGAVALQRGGEVAVRVVKERILSRLGLQA